ncbi:MAG: hypothetical protein K2K43_02565, partial [Alistipes sp.]|nr:hypothetical protein [Alistipes sp.]
DWVGKVNNNLWGNPQGSDYPRMSTLQRSIFEPCPKGYRVAPKDLWIAFTDDGANRSNTNAPESAWAKTLLNVLNISADGKSTTFATQRGFFCCYGVDNNGARKWQQEPSDFYPAAGYRARALGVVTGVGTYGCYWNNSPLDVTSLNATYLYIYATGVGAQYSNGGRGYAYPVRCVKEN